MRPSDAWNRLVEVRADDAGDPGVPGPGALIATYRYNGLNHRVQKILWDDADPQTPDTTIDYYYNAGWQVVEERVDGDVHAQYLWCLSYIDTPVLRWRDTTGNEELEETLYYTVDANKNVTALIDAATGNVVERYLYDPYGRVMFLKPNWSLQEVDGHDDGTVSAFGNEILFTGYRWNPAPAPGMGTYHARNREYHPTLGRFMQRDPLGYVDGGNLYAGYFAMWGGVDPWGLQFEPPRQPRDGDRIIFIPRDDVRVEWKHEMNVVWWHRARKTLRQMPGESRAEYLARQRANHVVSESKVRFSWNFHCRGSSVDDLVIVPEGDPVIRILGDGTTSSEGFGAKLPFLNTGSSIILGAEASVSPFGVGPGARPCVTVRVSVLSVRMTTVELGGSVPAGKLGKVSLTYLDAVRNRVSMSAMIRVCCHCRDNKFDWSSKVVGYGHRTPNRESVDGVLGGGTQKFMVGDEFAEKNWRTFFDLDPRKDFAIDGGVVRLETKAPDWED